MEKVASRFPETAMQKAMCDETRCSASCENTSTEMGVRVRASAMHAPKSTLETLDEEEEDDAELEDGTENLWPENPDQIKCGRAHRVKKDRKNHTSTWQEKLVDLSNFTTTSKIRIKLEQ